MDYLKNEITSLDRYNNNQLFFIAQDGIDYSVKDNMSYEQWCNVWSKCLTIKINGLENRNDLCKTYSHLNINSIHLFIKLKSGYSFKEHADDTNVYLHVLSGRKDVYVDGVKTTLNPNDSINILKGQLHKAESDNNTWAVSVGYNLTESEKMQQELEPIDE